MTARTCLPCVATAVLLLLAGCTRPTPEEPEPRFLFVQDAASGTAEPLPDGRLRLTLVDVDDGTLWFTDRPERHAGLLATRDFVTAWDVGVDSFASDPPNAAVLVHNATGGGRDVYVVELQEPRFDEAARVLQYVVVPLDAGHAFLASHQQEGRHGAGLPASFGEAELFIDSGAFALVNYTDADKRAFCLVYDCVPADQVGSGRAHFCALQDDGEVKCWGENDRGQLGQSSAGPA